MLASPPLLSKSYRSAILNTLGMAAYWTEGEQSGTVANDECGRFNGVYTNTPTLGVAGLLSGNPGTAVTYASASSRYVTITRGSFPQIDTDGTLMRWFRLTTASITQTLVDDDFNNGPFMYVTSANKLRIRLGWNAGAGTGADFSAATTLTTGVTYFAAATFNATVATLYLNGVQDGTAAVTHAMGTQTLALQLSRRGALTDLYLNGTASNAAIATRALTAAEIANLCRIGRGF